MMIMKTMRRMIMTPIIKFEDEKQMIELLKEWKKRLYLDDWEIAIYFAHQCEMSKNGLAGESNVNFVNMCGEIKILYPNDFDPKEYIMRQSQEQVLIHELLHFKYMGFEENGASTIEGAYYDEMQHQLLEQMARSLFLAKYDLQPDWFKHNTDVENDTMKRSFEALGNAMIEGLVNGIRGGF